MTEPNKRAAGFSCVGVFMRTVIAAWIAGGAMMLSVQNVAAQQTTYRYDSLGRLIDVGFHDGSAEDFALDAAGNRAVVDLSQTPGTQFVVSDTLTEEGVAAYFVVTRLGSAITAQSVSYATANGTAASGSDYSSGAGTLSFAAGETAKTILIGTILDTNNAENTETFFVNLSNATGGATIAKPQGTAEITTVLLCGGQPC